MTLFDVLNATDYVTPALELIDARTQLTAASVQLNVTRFEVLQAQAKLERETASVSL